MPAWGCSFHWEVFIYIYFIGIDCLFYIDLPIACCCAFQSCFFTERVWGVDEIHSEKYDERYFTVYFVGKMCFVRSPIVSKLGVVLCGS